MREIGGCLGAGNTSWARDRKKADIHGQPDYIIPPKGFDEELVLNRFKSLADSVVHTLDDKRLEIYHPKRPLMLPRTYVNIVKFTLLYDRSNAIDCPTAGAIRTLHITSIVVRPLEAL